MFEPGDALLAELAADSTAFPFEKLLAGTEGPHQPLPQGGWATGNAAAAHGLDLRMFYKVAHPSVLKFTAWTLQPTTTYSDFLLLQLAVSQQQLHT